MTDTPDTEPTPLLNEHGGVIHQVAGVVGVGSAAAIVEPPPEPT